jgi:L-amino acid N-acyltransferase YncA
MELGCGARHRFSHHDDVAVEVRRGMAGDAKGIAEVHVASWQAAYAHVFTAEYLAALSVPEREERWRVALGHDDAVVLVAEDSGVVVGFASAGSCRDDDAHDRSRGELHAIYVRPDYWDTGTGSRLHDEAVDALDFGRYTTTIAAVSRRNVVANRPKWGLRWAARGSNPEPAD